MGGCLLKAFSSEVETGSRQENASKSKNLEPRFDSIEAEKALEIGASRGQAY
jgi:hypothetical protein